MNRAINPGKRIPVAIGQYSGPAGLTEAVDGSASLALPYKRHDIAAGSTVEADGRVWTIAKVSASSFLPGYRVLELVPAKEG